MWHAELPQLGDKVREIISGTEGIVTGCVEYLWGCEQVLVSRPHPDPTKGQTQGDWWDVGRIELVERDVRRPVTYAAAAPTGADLPAPIR